MAKLDKAGESNSIKLSKGVYASLATVTSITDLSNHPALKRQTPVLRNDVTPVELCIEVKFEKEDGEEWSQRFYGDYKVDGAGNIKGWKAFANGVQDFFVKLIGQEELENRINDDYSMPSNLFNAVKGKQYYRISYVSGFSKKDSSKASYKEWNQIFLPDATIEEMQRAWASSSVYMESYKPDVVDEIELQRKEDTSDTSFNPEEFQESSDPTEEFEL